MSTLTFSLIQTNLHWENKAANLAMLEQKVRSIANTQVVVLPEMFSTGFSMAPNGLAESMEGETVAWMRRLAAEKRIILTGSIIAQEDSNYFNRLIWMQPNGLCGIYDKRHLFSLAGEHKYYTAGTKKLVASANGWKVNLLVCYDLRFPVWSRQPPLDDEGRYDVLVYVANWPERRAHAWRSLLVARAIENQCYVIGVNRVGNDGNDIYHSGNSMVINALGDILYYKEHDEDVYTISLQKEHLAEVRDKMRFLDDADQFLILKNA